MDGSHGLPSAMDEPLDTSSGIAGVMPCVWLRVATTGLRERGVCGVVGLRPRRGPPRRGALPQLHHRPPPPAPLAPIDEGVMQRAACKQACARTGGLGGGSRGGGWASFSEFLGWVWVHREHGGVRVDCARDGSVVRDPLSRAQLLLTMIGCGCTSVRLCVCLRRRASRSCAAIVSLVCEPQAMRPVSPTRILLALSNVRSHE
jgi:hypothetical protein